MYKVYIIAIVVFFPLLNLAQDNLFVKQEANFIEIDDQGNLYLIKQSELLKYNPQGKLTYRYANALLGNIHSVDAKNPLRIMLFFAESNALVFLNQQLAEISAVIYINDFSDVEAQLATVSASGGFWLFDGVTRSLLYFNHAKVIEKQSENLAKILNNNDVTQLSEQNQQVFLQTQNKTFVFDAYANLLTSYPYSSKYKVKANHELLNYFYENKIITYNTKDFHKQTMAIDSNMHAKQILINNNTLFILNNKGVTKKEL